jgi:hypothetical protein
MKRISFVVFLLACTTSVMAQKPAPTLNQTITIDLANSVESQPLAEEWIESLQFIPLETNPECYISSRNIYNLNKDHIVVSSNETVHLFSRDGKHLKSFKRLGKGPGEYGEIREIDLVSDRPEIMVASPNQRKIVCYDYDGNVTTEINLPFIALNIAPVSGGLFACYSGRMFLGSNDQDLNQIAFIDRKGKIVSKYLPFQYRMNSGTSVNFCYSGESGVYFINPAYSYDIDQAGPGDLFFMKYRFSFGNKNLDTTLLNNEKIMESAQANQSFGAAFTDLDHLAITTNTISFWGPVIQSKIRYGTRQINRKTGHVRFMELDSKFNFGYYSGMPIVFNPHSSGEYFTFCCDAVDMVEIFKKLTPDQKKILSKFEGFDRLVNLKEDDNPVLVLYKVKDF